MSEVCIGRDTWDEDDQPTGPECGQPATHRIYWTDGRYSPACERHATDVQTDPVGAQYVHYVQLLAH
jgi:hypothetical protein